MTSRTRYLAETRLLYYAWVLRKSCTRMPFRNGEQRGITRSVATRGMRLFTDKMRTVRRVINASPDPTGLTCSFRNGIRGGSGRLAPRRCLSGKTTCSAKGGKKRSGFIQSFACEARERKTSCVTRASSPTPLPVVSSRPWCRVFFFDEEREIGIRDYIINIHVTRRVPWRCSHHILLLYLFGDRPCICMSRQRAGRVYAFVYAVSIVHGERERLGTISVSIQHRYTPEGNRSQARYNLSLIASSPSGSLSFFLAHERTRH